MRSRRPALLSLVLLALLQLSCAAGNLTPARDSMPAARAGLRPEFRLFYDALTDYGDWTLIEPYGYVFRPSSNVVGWRPYQDGFWAPSDVYGWVWISTEAFGWATYHYGRWMYDRFQGWVWIPGLDWAPAWVAWNETDSYVGWSPLLASGSATPPGGAYLYAPASRLASTDLRSFVKPQEDVSAAAEAQPVENVVRRDGVSFNAGPSIDRIERVTGPLRRVRIDDLVTPMTARDAADAAATQARGTSDTEVEPVQATRAAAERAAREAREISENGGAAPARLPVVRPISANAPPAKRAPRRSPGLGRGAPADSVQ